MQVTITNHPPRPARHGALGRLFRCAPYATAQTFEFPGRPAPDLRHGRAMVSHAATSNARPTGERTPADRRSTPSGPSTLVLGEAINIASAAVGAYLTPTIPEELKERCVCRGANGTTTQYIDGSGTFIANRLQSILEVSITEVSGFAGADLITAADLYIEVGAGDSYARTPTQRNNNSPTFSKPLYLFPNHPSGSSPPAADVPPPVLTVRVFDDMALGFTNKAIEYAEIALQRLSRGDIGDVALGSATIDLPEGWEWMDPIEYTVEVLGKNGKVAGKVTLLLTASALQEPLPMFSVVAPGSDAPPADAPAADSPPPAGAAALAAMASPQLAIAEGVPALLASHVAAAAALHPAMASLAARPNDPSVTQSDAAPLPAAVTPPVDTGVIELSSLNMMASVAAPAGDGEEGAMDVPMMGLVEFTEGQQLMEEAKVAVQNAWRELPKVFPDAFLVDGVPIAFLSSEYDTQVWVHRNAAQKKMVISFRGTQANNAWDWLTDAIVFTDATARDPTTGGLRTVRDLGGVVTPDGSKKIHRGFYKAYRSVEPQIRQMITLCTGGEDGWAITTTGHSLGGALATVCAYDLATSRDVPYPVDSYTFGSPRTSNEAFTTAYNELVPSTFRIHNHNDVVAQVPWFFGYKHVNNKMRLDGEGKVYLDQGNPVSVFGDGIVPPKVLEKLKSKPGWLDGLSVKSLLQRFRVGAALLSGQGSASHEFDEYVLSLAEVLLVASADERYAVRDAVQGLRDALKKLERAGAVLRAEKEAAKEAEKAK
eukprot:jgi/Ulvmu1/11739/UM008_0152.1